MTLRPILSSRVTRILFVIFVVSLILYFAHPVVLSEIGQYLIAEDSIQPADAIIVIGRDKKGERVEHAVKLFRQGLGKQLIISSCQIAWQTNELDIMKQQVLTLGVPREAMLIDRDGTTPTVQAEHASDLMVRTGLKSAILVSSSYHSARAIKAFRSVMSLSGIKVASAPVATTIFDPGAWWKSRKGAKTVFKEYWEWVWDDMES